MDQNFKEFARLIMQQSMLREIVMQLQRRHQFNSHLLIYSIWYAQAARGRLHKSEFEMMIKSIVIWHESVVLSIAKLSRVIKQSRNAKLRALQNSLDEVSDFAKNVEINMLYDASHLAAQQPRRNERQQLNDVCYNLIYFYKYFHYQFSEKDHSEMSFLINLLFPNSETAEIEQLLKEFATKLKITQQTGEQIELI